MLKSEHPADGEKLEMAFCRCFNSITPQLIKDGLFMSRGNEPLSQRGAEGWLQAGTAGPWQPSAAFSRDLAFLPPAALPDPGWDLLLELV